ncbi:hypothetical protein NPX13_g1240 [Xylaria arbuscula]|uniref:Rhodopsin domain-containing protein n=1 Tax=Xylaria arbuscula TaxID=114810 RepID=A0A9W8TRE7_9PEZI|nr:hypothetical protein NPX13_g1240 [Xylaria arbuscula]
MASTPSVEDLASLPPEYLAVDTHLKLLHTSIAFIVLTTVIYILFLVSRIFCAQRNGWETWVLYPISYLFQLLLGILCILFVKYGGTGRHVEYWLLNDPSTVGNFLKIQTATEFIYVAGVTFPKVCILLMYLSIFVERKIRIAAKIVIAVIVTNWIATGIIADFTICQPFAFKWDKSIPGGHCSNLMAAYRWISIPNILTDLAIIFLPFSALYHLQTTRIRKIGILITFLTGGLGIITAILRFVGFFTVDLESDPTYLGVDTQIYTLVEPNAYFICSCLPGMRPLLRRIFDDSGLFNTINRYYHSITSDSKTTQRDLDGICLDVPRGSYKASVSAPKDTLSENIHDDDAALIRTNKSYQVAYSPA